MVEWLVYHETHQALVCKIHGYGVKIDRNEFLIALPQFVEKQATSHFEFASLVLSFSI